MQVAQFVLRPAILLIGDSLTQYGYGLLPCVESGWAGLLSAAYVRRADVLNRGYSGYNTRHVVDLLPSILGRLDKTLFCTVWLGANDATMESDPQHVSISDYESNLQTIIKQIRERVADEAITIFVLTPPPVDEVAWADYFGAQESNCHFVDTWSLLEGETDNRKAYLSDGLHLNLEGNKQVYKGLMEVIKAETPHLYPMADNDGDGRYGKSGVPLQEKLWRELCGLPLLS
jgi:isoamyl acetate esterase